MADLVIRGFITRGFDYPNLVNCYPWTFPTVIQVFGPFLVAKRVYKAQYRVPL